MINENSAKLYCSEDISLIENYQAAIADQKRMWVIHHRRECDENGRTLFTKEQMIKLNIYFYRPSKELIFVTRKIHAALHKEQIKKWHDTQIEKQSIQVIQLTKDRVFIKEYPSIHEAGRQTGVALPSIRACIKGRCKTAGGFIWKYKKV